MHYCTVCFYYNALERKTNYLRHPGIHVLGSPRGAHHLVAGACVLRVVAAEDEGARTAAIRSLGHLEATVVHVLTQQREHLKKFQ